MLVSKTAGTLLRVATVPVLVVLGLLAVVTAAVLAQLKQYSVLVLRSVLGNVTTCPVTLVAVAMPGQAEAVAGQLLFVVFTVKVVARPSVYPVG